MESSRALMDLGVARNSLGNGIITVGTEAQAWAGRGQQPTVARRRARPCWRCCDRRLAKAHDGRQQEAGQRPRQESQPAGAAARRRAGAVPDDIGGTGTTIFAEFCHWLGNEVEGDTICRPSRVLPRCRGRCGTDRPCSIRWIDDACRRGGR
jgi:hypothetical protein